MIYEIAAEQYKQTEPLFGDLPLSLVIKGVIAGNSPGIIWTDRQDQPGTVLMWDRSHCFYLAGSPDNRQFNQTLREFVTDELLPMSLPFNGGFFKIYYPGSEWAALIPEIFDAVTLTPVERSLYTLPMTPHIDQATLPLAKGCQLKRIDQTLLTNARLENVDALTEEIASCWCSVDRFLEHGFGFCICNEDEIVGWCTAEYVSDGWCGIGIETMEAYQKRGFATLTASAFVNHCKAHHIQPHWDSWKANTPSIRVAEKVGFQKLFDYSVYLSRKSS